MAEQNLNQSKDKFNEAQLEALNVPANPYDIDEVLKSAKEVGVISDEVIAKIEKDESLKKILESSFVKSFDKARGKMAQAEAFRSAFRQVYGKLLLEQESESGFAASHLTDRLAKVLKFDFDKHGYKGRHELQSASMRLRLYLRDRWKTQKPVKIAEAKAEKLELAKRKRTTEIYLGDVNGLGDIADDLDTNLTNYASSNPEIEELKKIDIEIANLESKLNATNLPTGIDEVSPSEVVNFFSLHPAIVFSLSKDKLNSLFEKTKTDQLYARKMLGIDGNKVLTDEDIKSGFSRLVKLFHPDKFPVAIYNDDDREKASKMVKAIFAARETLKKDIVDKKTDPLSDPFSQHIKIINEYLIKKSIKIELGKELKSKERENADKLLEITDLLDIFNDGINKIKGDPDVSKTVKDLCDKYLAAYATWTKKTENKNPAGVEDFYKNTLQVFIPNIKDLLTAEGKTLDASLVAVDLRIGQFQKDIIPEDEFESVLGKAFHKAKTGAEMKKLEREHEERVGKQKQVKDTYEYFAHHHNLEVFLESQNSYAKIMEGGTGKLSLDGEFYEKRAKARRSFEVTDKALKDLYEPNQSSIERTLESVAKRKKSLNEKFDEKAERDNITREYHTNKDNYTRDIAIFEEQKDVYENIFEHAAKLHAETKKLVQNLGAAQKLGIPFEDDFNASSLVEEFKKFEPKSRSFNPKEFLDYSEKLREYFGSHHKVENLQKAFDDKLAASEEDVKDAKKILDKAQGEVEHGKNLTDAQAAKKIIGAMIAQQFKDMPLEEQDKLCTLILAEDVATLQTSESYESLAQRGSAEVLKTVEKAKDLKLRGRLIGFQYKEGGNVVTPFKGLKPENFNDWASIEKMFTLGKLNYKNGFFLLAALELFDQENGGVPSIQTRRTAEKLKMVLAKQLGVHERMDVAGVSKIVNDAFKAQIEKVRPLVKAHFDLHESKGGEAKDYKRQVLNMKYEDLADKLRNNEINQEVFALKVKGLAKEAAEADIDDVDFSQDSALAGFWNSKESQWLKDKGVDAAKFVGKKALGVAVFAPAKLAAKGLWGTAKLTAGLGFQATALPFRMAKYPLLLGAKPLVGAVNLFRKAPLTPLPGIRDSIKNDVARTLGYAGSTVKGTVQGAKTAVSGTTAGEWNAVKFTHQKYAERTKHKAALRAEKLKLYGEKSALEAVETEVSPFIDLAEYKGKIEALDKVLGTTTHFPADTAKAGHTEAAKKHEESHAPAAANDNHEKHDAHSKDDHGHDAHGKAAGAHH